MQSVGTILQHFENRLMESSIAYFLNGNAELNNAEFAIKLVHEQIIIELDDGEKKHIKHDHGDLSAPRKLKIFENKITKILGGTNKYAKIALNT